MKLDQTVVATLKPAMMATWNYIGHDVYEMCDGDNLCAVEMVIDADRLDMCGGDAAANLLVRELCKEHGYSKVLKFLNKHFRFL